MPDQPETTEGRVGDAPRPPAQIAAGWLDDERNLHSDPEGFTYQRWFTHWTDATEAAIRAEVERIIDSYSLCMVGTGAEPYIAACVDDVLAEVLGWPVRYEVSRG